MQVPLASCPSCPLAMGNESAAAELCTRSALARVPDEKLDLLWAWRGVALGRDLQQCVHEPDLTAGGEGESVVCDGLPLTVRRLPW